MRLQTNEVEQFSFSFIFDAAPLILFDTTQLDKVPLHAALPPRVLNVAKIERDVGVVPDDAERRHVQPGPRVGPRAVEFQTGRRLQLRYPVAKHAREALTWSCSVDGTHCIFYSMVHVPQHYLQNGTREGVPHLFPLLLLAMAFHTDLGTNREANFPCDDELDTVIVVP